MVSRPAYIAMLRLVVGTKYLGAALEISLQPTSSAYAYLICLTYIFVPASGPKSLSHLKASARERKAGNGHAEMCEKVCPKSWVHIFPLSCNRKPNTSWTCGGIMLSLG